MSNILDNNADFQSFLDSAPEMPDFDGYKIEKNKTGSVLLTLGIALLGICVIGAIMQHHSNRIIDNIRISGINRDEPEV